MVTIHSVEILLSDILVVKIFAEHNFFCQSALSGNFTNLKLKHIYDSFQEATSRFIDYLVKRFTHYLLREQFVYLLQSLA